MHVPIRIKLPIDIPRLRSSCSCGREGGGTSEEGWGGSWEEAATLSPKGRNSSRARARGVVRVRARVCVRKCLCASVHVRACNCV